MKEKFGSGTYAFDEAKYLKEAKRKGLHETHVKNKILKIGDGTLVEVVTPTMAICGDEGILPSWCRKVEV